MTNFSKKSGAARAAPAAPLLTALQLASELKQTPTITTQTHVRDEQSILSSSNFHTLGEASNMLESICKLHTIICRSNYIHDI